MSSSHFSRFSPVSLLIAFAVLSACSKDRVPAAPTVPASKPVATAPATSTPAKPTPARLIKAAPVAAPVPATTTFHITAVNMGRAVNAAREVTQPSNRFAANEKTIYAGVATAGVTAGATLNARWNYLEGAGQAITSVTQRIATDGAATTTFTLQNPDLWPEGKYNVEISVDGKLVDTRAFTIGKAVP